MLALPKHVRVCISAEEAMTAATVVWRAAQEQRHLQQYLAAMGNPGAANVCEEEFMRLIAISNKLADSTRQEVMTDD